MWIIPPSVWRAALAIGLGVAIGAILASTVWRTETPPGDPLARVTIAYSPSQDLEAIDVAMIRAARQSVDMAAYVLTDAAIVQALEEAAKNGARVRIVLDSEAADRDVNGLLADLATTAGVTIRTKPPGALMHLKAYAVDGSLLRIGSANFSWSGERFQDNELSLLRSADEAKRFEVAFLAVWKIAK